VVNTAKTGWDIIKDGRPVSSTETTFANALPKDADWTNLSGWKNQKTDSLSWAGYNIFGNTLFKVSLQGSWSYNGSLNERGRFVNNATITPKIENAFTWNVNSKARVGNPINIGTQQQPVGSLPIIVEVNTSGLFQNYSQSAEFTMNGDGTSKATWSL
jgi:hypothetical protein